MRQRILSAAGSPLRRTGRTRIFIPKPPHDRLGQTLLHSGMARPESYPLSIRKPDARISFNVSTAVCRSYSFSDSGSSS